jgi:hypothetical protein
VVSAGKREDRNTHTEFGGGPKSPQRYPDGSSKPLTVREEARVKRQVGIAGINPAEPDQVGEDLSGKSEEEIEARFAEDARRTAVRKANRERLSGRTNGYSDEVQW